MQKIKNIHIIAVCGTGMSSLAGLFKEAGFRVTGSDQNIYPPISDVLKELEIECFNGFDPRNIKEDVDLVIIGNAVSKTNVEVEEVMRRNIPYLSFPAALAKFFLKEKTPLVITGTHGKTTTTSLLAWLLESAGEDPGFMIGGILKDFKRNFKFGKGKYFVIEGDEYDTAFFDKGAKFLHYRPELAVITSIEFDHVDIYKNLEEIKNAFRKFVNLVPEKGRVITVSGDENIVDVLKRSDLKAGVETYGLENGADWLARNIKVFEGGATFDLFFKNEFKGNFTSRLLGYHNLKNTLSVMAIAFNLGLTAEKIRQGLDTFRGVKRRQDIISRERDIILIDDFAHHPTAIHETLAALRLHFPQRRIWSIFEPRSATSRRNIFQQDFVEAFRLSDRTIIADVFSSDKIPVENRLDVKKLVRDMNEKKIVAELIPSAVEIVNQIGGQLKPGDLVCVMSSGGFDRIHEKLITRIKQND